MMKKLLQIQMMKHQIPKKTVMLKKLLNDETSDPQEDSDDEEASADETGSDEEDASSANS